MLLSIIVLSLSAWVGASVLRGSRELDSEAREDFGLVLAAALTLLGLIIGFTFSMAINRYDSRKNYEEAEANAIGTEYLRAGLLPAADAATTRGMIGYAAGKPKSRGILLLVLPFVVSIAFFLIADIDSPRGGIIRVDPQNLLSLAESLR